jgi:hypothetical protein
MRLRVLTRSALVLLPLLVLAGRLHAQRTASPQGMTQDVNRCLTIVRVAATRRRGERQDRQTTARVSAALRADGRASAARTARLAKSA